MSGLFFAQAQMLCDINLWPVYAGAIDHIETTSCIAYDKTNDLILVGGTSEDQTPNSNFAQIGFLYALDLSGNWQWGGNIF